MEESKKTLEIRNQRCETRSCLLFCSPPGFQTLMYKVLSWHRLTHPPLNTHQPSAQGLSVHPLGILPAASALPSFPDLTAHPLICGRLRCSGPGDGGWGWGGWGVWRRDSEAQQPRSPPGVTRGKAVCKRCSVLATYNARRRDMQTSPRPSQVPKHLLPLRLASDSANSHNQKTPD